MKMDIKIKNHVNNVLILVIASVLLVCSVAAGEKKLSTAYWPQWQGPAMDNKSSDTGLLKKWPKGGPKMLWSVEGIGAGFSSVTIADGLIYISGMVDKQGVITAIEADGTVKWRKPYGLEWKRNTPGARASVTVYGGRLFVFSGTGIAACLDAKTGVKKWSVDVVEKFGGVHHAWGYGESLLVFDDKVICTPGGVGASIVALNVNDGSLVWKTDELSEKATYCSAIAIEKGGKKLIIQILWDSLVGIDATNGKVVLKYDTKNYKLVVKAFGRGSTTNTPLYHDGFLYLTSGYDRGSVKLKLSDDATKVTKVWVNPDLDVHHGGFILDDGYLYGSNWLSNSRGGWVCVDWEDGKTMYEDVEQFDKHKGSISYADGMLYCYDEKDGVLALVRPTPKKFDIVSRFEITMGEKEHWAHPVICGGVLYMRHGDVLMAYDIKAGK
jgi:outer membrane protein assembly factor BamB